MQSDTGRNSVRRIVVLSLALSVLCLELGCHNSPCYTAGFDEGERFQFTVLEVHKTLLARPDISPNTCDILPLAPGDSFILVAGRGYENGGADFDCKGRAARPEVPPFAIGIVTSCTEVDVVLGQTCTSITDTTCGVRFGMNVTTDIHRGVNTITRGRLYMGVHDSCASGGCDLEIAVRIDRLAP